MNHLKSQAEVKKNIHRESKINKHKMKEMKANKVRGNTMRCHEDEDFLPVEHDETFNMDHGEIYSVNILLSLDSEHFHCSTEYILHLSPDKNLMPAVLADC